MRAIFMCFVVEMVALAAGASGAFAQTTCRDDLVKADQTFNTTRSDLQKASAAAPAVKCAAYRRHVTSINAVRAVFARCDTSSNKVQNAAATNAALAEFTRQMREACPAAAQKAPAAAPAPAKKS